MTTAGLIFLVGFWTLLIITTAWSYNVLLSQPSIPVGPLEDEYHPLIYDLEEHVEEPQVKEDR